MLDQQAMVEEGTRSSVLGLSQITIPNVERRHFSLPRRKGREGSAEAVRQRDFIRRWSVELIQGAGHHEPRESPLSALRLPFLQHLQAFVIRENTSERAALPQVTRALVVATEDP